MATANLLPGRETAMFLLMPPTIQTQPEARQEGNPWILCLETFVLQHRAGWRRLERESGVANRENPVILWHYTYLSSDPIGLLLWLLDLRGQPSFYSISEVLPT